MLAGIATTIAVSFNTLLPVVPVLMERGGPHGAAGAATAALFVGAVAGELITPWLMSRWSSARLLVAGQLMTAVPSLVYALPHPDPRLMLVAAALRGLGMGVAIVVSVALVGELTTPERRGRSIGYYGLALSAPGIILPFPGGIVRSGSKVGSRYKKLRASTNDAYCPTLRGLVQSALPEGANTVYEIVIDGLDLAAVEEATRVGLRAACGPGVLRISAGNYGGKLGPFHLHLHKLLA